MAGWVVFCLLKDSFVPSAPDSKPPNPEDLNKARKQDLQRESEQEEPSRGVKTGPPVVCIMSLFLFVSSALHSQT